MRRGILGVWLVLATAAGAAAQAPGTIEGRVLTAAGVPARGATVVADTPRVQARTDARGRYRLAGVAPGIRRLSATLAGAGAAEAWVALEPAGTVRVDLELASHRATLAGGVASGYGPVARAELTGSVAMAEGAELRSAPVAGVLEALQGLLTGVDVLPQSTMPGARVDLRIRGVRAVDNVDDPLYVVDGLPVVRIDELSAAGVESITILKDAAATALYGSEGKNGVVLVTTRRGEEGPLRAAVDVRYGAQGARGFAPLMNGVQFAEYRREAARASGTYTGDAALFSPDELISLQRGASTDWQRLSARAGGVREGSLSAGGTLAGARVGLRGRYLGQTGVSLAQALERWEGSADAARTFGPLRLSASFLRTRGLRNLGAGEGLWWQAAAASPLAAVRDSGGALVVHPAGEPWALSPLVQAERNTDETTSNRATGTFASELRLPGGVGWQVRYGVDRRRQDERIARPLESYPREWTGTGHRATTAETSVTLERGVSAADRIELLAGFGRNPARDSLYSDKTGAGGSRTTLYGWSALTWRWFLARAAYARHDRLFLTLTARQDGYDQLPAGARHYRTAALGAAWRLDQLPWVRRLGPFSQLRLRASLGRTTFPPSIDARDLPPQPWSIIPWSYEPERLDQLDAGLDAGLLHGRITAVVDVYQRDSRNQGVIAPLPAGTSYSSYGLVQGAATRNRGLEAALSTVNLRRWRGLDWTTELALTHNRARITRIPSGAPSLSGSFVGLPPNDPTEVGQSVFLDYRALGIWQQGQEAAAAVYGAEPGAIRVDDLNHDGRIDLNDAVILGDSYPTLVGSLENRVRHGAFQLSLLLAARLGYTIHEPYAPSTTSLGINYRFNALQRDFWTPSHPSNAAPRPGLGAYSSSLSYRSGSHWRVRQVTLEWKLPTRLVGGAAASLYAGARNPWISGDFRGYDPEYPAVGAPPYRTVFLGAATTF